MSVNIHVKVSPDGDYYVKPADDPKYMKISEHPQNDKKIKWHCNDHEFAIVFKVDEVLLENPFNDTMGLRLESETKKIEEDVKDHEEIGQKVYAYSIEPPNPASELKKADPSLIIQP